ncbi:MAG: undecaprenyldiphospho-muramoylpentapeptide beta-N-acetylglucosaminyltransferase [Candidatus Dormibacteraeota bacterium]|nr:undecaprenyldiphospho-muramoylpentapeptide beta-N-acetylglucosaminyltransferase [Candidatus Dormibacteraeota bacterium]
MRVLIAGGGTGGHLTPALAVAQALRDADPGGEVVVVGREGGVAERLVSEAGIPLRTLRISGVDASDPRTVVLAASRLPASTFAAGRLLRELRTDVVVGAGGYVCVPVVAAATLRRIPTVLMEQNAYPGRATRLLARRSRMVAASFASTKRLLPGATVRHTGNPIRREIRSLVPAPVAERCSRLLVMGGSQGAHTLNAALEGMLPDLLATRHDVTVVHQCGERDWESVRASRAALPAHFTSRYVAAPFFDDIGERIAASDLVVMRAGGSSLAECSALGRPMILVPYPHAGGHQRFNAMPYAHAGAAVTIDDEDCTPARLLTAVSEVMEGTERWLSMCAASARCGIPDAADRVARLVLDVGARAAA